MTISDILRRKGHDVATIAPGESVRVLVDRLAEMRIGALVVSTDGNRVEGMASERDVMRGLHTSGASLLDRPVSSIMTAEVETCGPTTSVDDLMRLMTERRFRHVPVVDDGRLVGIVSIGDVVKRRIDDLQDERDQLVGYIRS
ncbi:CBS domain-containing protein [Aquipuribacter nitratireducens]|uniref:CBS domain-containing protein n=1 Tax=Aquipuribacter nitratireducens TaxID=650104 RepID=A0ABW0GQP8_9MICO